jgi:hypothetical protein
MSALPPKADIGPTTIQRTCEEIRLSYEVADWIEIAENIASRELVKAIGYTRRNGFVSAR